MSLQQKTTAISARSITLELMSLAFRALAAGLAVSIAAAAAVVCLATIAA